jgi:hypothetical protein
MVQDTTTLDDYPTTEQQLQHPPPNSNINVDQERALSIKTLDKNPYNIPMQDLREKLSTPNIYEEAYYHQQHDKTKTNDKRKMCTTTDEVSPSMVNVHTHVNNNHLERNVQTKKHIKHNNLGNWSVPT